MTLVMLAEGVLTRKPSESPRSHLLSNKACNLSKQAPRLIVKLMLHSCQWQRSSKIKRHLAIKQNKSCISTKSRIDLDLCSPNFVIYLALDRENGMHNKG